MLAYYVNRAQKVAENTIIFFNGTLTLLNASHFKGLLRLMIDSPLTNFDGG
jgi:hypothetical protein